MSEREALAMAIVALGAEEGFERLSVERLCRRADVPARVFEALFESLEDCWLRTFEAHSARFDAKVIGAYRAAGSWREGLRAAGYAAASFMDREPEVVRFGVVAMFSAGERAQLLREAQLQRMVDLVDAGRAELDDPDSMSRANAEAIFGAVYQTLVRQLEGGERRPAVSFVPELMYVAVRPYLGHGAALEELSLPAPPGH